MPAEAQGQHGQGSADGEEGGVREGGEVKWELHWQEGGSEVRTGPWERVMSSLWYIRQFLFKQHKWAAFVE